MRGNPSMHVHVYAHPGALSGFKADFGPLLGTSDSPARDASRNMKIFEFDLLYRLKMSEVRPRFF